MGKTKNGKKMKESSGVDCEGKGEEDIEEKNISKSTSRAVSQMRIREIEKSIRSMSSILDTRTLHHIENVHKKDLLSKKLAEANKRSNQNRRDKTVAQSSILNQGILAAAALKAGGGQLANTTEEFGDEEKIWKHKYRTSSYTQKRRFNNPRLHEYYRSLNGEEQKNFRQKCRESLYSMSSKLREDVSETKSKMDQRGIFHPAANAHRAHCSYLMKVYRDVEASVIEDPVLRKMRLDDKYAAEQNEDIPHTFEEDSLETSCLSASRGPVYRSTKSSQSKVRSPKSKKEYKRKEKKKTLSSMFDMVENSNKEQENAQNLESSKKKTGNDHHLRSNVSSKANIPTAEQVESSQPQIRTTPTSRAQVDSSPVPITSDSRNKNLHRQKSLKGTNDAGSGMDDFTDSVITDWMINSLQNEQMAAVVNSSGQPTNIPLGPDGQLSWKSLPELKQNNESNPPPRSPVISFSQFDELFKSYDEQIQQHSSSNNNEPEEKDRNSKNLVVDTQLQEETVDPDKDVSSKPSPPRAQPADSKKLLPPVNQRSLKSQKSHSHTPTSLNNKAGNSKGGAKSGRDESKRILDNMQPHLDAFVAVNISKRPNNIQMVQKMLGGMKKTPGSHSMQRAATADGRLGGSHPKSAGVSEVGKVAVQGLKKKNTRVRGVDGFRNVFMEPESEGDDSDDSSESSSSLQIQSSTSEESSEYDSEDEHALAEMRRRASVMGARKLAKKRSERKMKTEDSSVIQEKQMMIWEVLEIKTEDRVKLMNKYSSEEYSSRFQPYFSSWTEIALLVAMRQELKKLFIWFQRGLLTVPDENPEGSLWIFSELLRRLPPILKGSYSVSTRNKKSVRSEACHSVLEKTRSLFTFEQDDENKMGFAYPKSVLPFLYTTVKQFDRLLLDKLNDAESTIGDVIPYGNGTCKEWLLSKMQKFPEPKS